MRYRNLFAPITFLAGFAYAAPGAGPQPAKPAPAIAVPKDVAFPGAIALAVDATDTDRRIFAVHETIPVTAGRELVLLYPKWLPGTHAPTELLVRNDDRYRTVRIEYYDGLRYPHLERHPSQPARLDEILAPRK